MGLATMARVPRARPNRKAMQAEAMNPHANTHAAHTPPRPAGTIPVTALIGMTSARIKARESVKPGARPMTMAR